MFSIDSNELLRKIINSVNIIYQKEWLSVYQFIRFIMIRPFGLRPKNSFLKGTFETRNHNSIEHDYFWYDKIFTYGES